MPVTTLLQGNSSRMPGSMPFFNTFSESSTGYSPTGYGDVLRGDYSTLTRKILRVRKARRSEMTNLRGHLD
jgi:hypothetical protein